MDGPAAGRRVLGCFPHPDDEVFAGGLLAWCAARGAAVELLCATRGERGVDRRGLLAPGPELAAWRSRELAAACAALGIAAPRFAELPDGGVADAGRAAAEGLVAAELARARPHLVVTLDADGAYGHRDHIAWSAIVAAAVRRVEPGRRPRLLHAVFPRRHFARLWALARRAGVAAELDPERLGVDVAATDLCLDVSAQAGRKLAACAAHASQLDLDPGSFFRRLYDPLLAREWYQVADGAPLPPGAADPFAGL
ncbi:MAG: PIG-L deacetylase family protein [Candidatus Binatia bacterium]